MNFWDAVDSQSGPYTFRLDPDPTPWEVARRGDGSPRMSQCLALNGRGQRCSGWGTEAFPFCEKYHAERARGAALAGATELPLSLLDAVLGDLICALNEKRCGPWVCDFDDSVDAEIVRRFESGGLPERVQVRLDDIIRDRLEQIWSEAS